MSPANFLPSDEQERRVSRLQPGHERAGDPVSQAPCSRCRTRPRQAGQRWCRSCRAESKRRQRGAQAGLKAEAVVKVVQSAVPAGPVGGRPERTIPAGGRWPLTQPGCCANCDGAEADVGTLIWTPAGIPLCPACYSAVWPS